MGADRRSDLRIEAIGVAAVEQQAITEGLSVARPLWDAHGVDLIVYDVADGLAEVKATGVQVKAYGDNSMMVYTSYPDALVMAYLVAAGTADASLFVLTAAQARRMTVEYTTALTGGLSSASTLLIRHLRALERVGGGRRSSPSARPTGPRSSAPFSIGRRKEPGAVALWDAVELVACHTGFAS